MLKNHFPLRVVAYDADGVQRNVACLADIVELVKEKADRYNDDESKRFLSELAKPAAIATETAPAEEKAPAKAPEATKPPPAAAKAPAAKPAASAKKPAPKAAAPAKKRKR